MSSCSSSNGAPGRNRPRRVPTRETCVSTGMSGMPRRRAARTRRSCGRRRAARRARRARGHVELREVVERGRVGERAQDRLDPRATSPWRCRRGGSPPRPPRAAPRAPRPAREAVAQAQERDVAVAVVRRLREHRQDQLVERAAGAAARPAAVDERAAGRAARARGGARAGSSRGAGGRRHARHDRAAMIERPRPSWTACRVVVARAPGRRPARAVLHGVPDAGELWTPFLERSGGVAPDLLGFGGSGQARRPRLLDRGLRATGSTASATSPGSTRAARAARLGLGRARVGAARARAGRRLVAIDAVPFLPGYRWHPSRASGGRLLGEVAMGMAIGPVVRRLLPPAGPSRCSPRSIRAPSGHPAALPREPAGGARGGRAGLGTIAAPALVLQGDAIATSRRASPTAWPRRWATAAWSTSRAPATGRGSTGPS